MFKASLTRRCIALTAMALYVPLLAGSNVAPAGAQTLSGRNIRSASLGRNAVYHMKLLNGNDATVYANGVAEITTPQGASELRRFPVTQKYDDISTGVSLPDKASLMMELSKEKSTHPFAEGRVIVVFRDGVSASNDTVSVPGKTLRSLALGHAGQSPAAPAYTNDSNVNRVLASMGVAKQERLFKRSSRSALSALRSSAQNSGHAVLNIANAYRLHVTRSSVPRAVTALLKLPGVAYASPDWIVAPMRSQGIPIPGAAIQKARRTLSPRMAASIASAAPSAIPSNYAVTASAQSMLNAPSNNTLSAFDEIQKRFHRLPGEGEIITNVSIGDLDDASAAANSNDPCNGSVSAFGPTTTIIGGQRYIDWPSMPLIAAYSADSNGNLSNNEVCGVDPQLGEVGLDFSMMAPLPHDRQRGGEMGSGLGDLLGIAPGATYRLVVPQVDQNFSITTSDVDAAFLAAAQQTPRPNVITASLGFGFDAFGFPGRYLEDDPLSLAVIASIVNNDNIVVCVSANDGTRLFTNAAIGPSGGSAPTEQIQPGGNPTDLNDITFSTVPSRDFDSGSIDVGGTTLDDIFAAPPHYPENRRLASQHAFPETRWTGFTSFSSGFGSRVNVSAPSDNVIGVAHTLGGNFDKVDLFINGGTSASAPETAAAAAVALQVARLTGRPFQNALEVRDFLRSTASAVPGAPQSDVYNNVGPQINVGRAVETLLAKAGVTIAPAVPRIAVAQRRNFGNLDGVFLSDTDPTNIDLQGPVSAADNTNTDRDEKAWITIAPDWEGLPANAEFRLNVVGRYSSPVATTRWARLLPEQILRAAGLPLASPSSRTVNLRYRAFVGTHHLLAERIFSLTFGPADPTTRAVLAPVVPPVIAGATIPVTYDLRNVRNLSNPTLVVSKPGRFDPATGPVFTPSVSVPLSGLSGTVHVPVNRLHGGGVYGIGILFGTVGSGCSDLFGAPGPCPLYSDFAFTRVASPGSGIESRRSDDPRPVAPLLSSGTTVPAHVLAVPYGAPFRVSWNVQNVPSATGAFLEVSAPAPSFYANLNPFNNPNGTVPDHDGLDTGSQLTVPLSGTSGTLTLDSNRLIPGFQAVLRVVPMRGSMSAGEGSDVSTVFIEGIVPSDGGNMRSGYSVSPNGTGGLLSSLNPFGVPSGDISTETFSQLSNRTTHLVATESFPTSSLPHVFISHGFGYKGNLGLFGYICDSEGPCPERTSRLVNNGTGTVISDWTPGFVCNLCLNFGYSALYSDVTKAPFLVPLDGNGGMYRLFTSDIKANTFSKLYDITAPLLNCTENFQARGFAVNTETNMATAVFDGSRCGGGPRGGPSGGPIVITTNLADGKFTSFIGRGSGSPFGAAIDSTTNRLAILTPVDAGLSIYNLGSKSSFEIQLPNVSEPGAPSHDVSVGFGAFVVADPIHHLFVIERPFSEHTFIDNNPLSEVLVYDEAGHLLKELKRFNSLGLLNRPNWYYLQINPVLRKGYFLTPPGQEIEPFKY